MSLDAIDHKLTNTTTDEKGITWWTNPNIDVKINSKGKVISLKTDKEKPRTNIGHCFRVMNGKISKSTQASFESLFCRVVLGKKLKGCSFYKLDETQDYSEENYQIINNTSNKVISKGGLKVTYGKDVVDLKADDLGKQYFTKYEGKNEHITEDGAVFPTRELAEWHQTNVSKGKGNAQVVLDYNGGYVLAEQIFLQEVKYNKKQPYVNFVDVMNNNKGIVSNVCDEYYIFDKLGKLSRIMNIGLGGIVNLVVKTETQAVKIQKELETYVKAEEAYNSSVLKLKDLLKQVS